MLIEFRVTNFRSFKDKKSISFLASHKDGTLQKTHYINTQNSGIPKLLKSAVVYGANASGKSNLVLAFRNMEELVKNSTNMPKERYRELYEPFCFDREYKNKSTTLEIILLIDNVRYQYGFEYNKERINAEWLLVYKKNKAQRWFEYHFDHKKNQLIWEPFSIHFKGEARGHRELWQVSKTERSLFLTQASQLNSQLLKPLYNWFENVYSLPIDYDPTDFEMIGKFIEDFREEKKQVMRLMRMADETIKDIQIKSKKTTRGNFRHVHLSRIINDQEQWLSAQAESRGTRHLLEYVVPFLFTAELGGLVVIDEFNASFHPLLSRHLLKLLHNPDFSSHGAQFWITTHDTSLLDPELLRRDQIWFTEKQKDGSSDIYSLCEFSPRKNEAFERGYLQGRYGAIPFLTEFLF